MARSISYTRKISEPIDSAFEIISTYKNYKDFIPGCIDSRVISEEGNMQVGQLKFEMFGKSYLIESKISNLISNLKLSKLRGLLIASKVAGVLLKKKKKQKFLLMQPLRYLSL